VPALAGSVPALANPNGNAVPAITEVQTIRNKEMAIKNYEKSFRFLWHFELGFLNLID